MSGPDYDVLVIGPGVGGSAATLRLTERGAGPACWRLAAGASIWLAAACLDGIAPPPAGLVREDSRE
jgi:glycine/D-amino acid oxidase-like deaminating enzyme